MNKNIIGVAITNKLTMIDSFISNELTQKDFTYLLRPYRHHDVIELMYENNITSASKVQGFIDQDYNFLTRKEAYSFVLKHNIKLHRREGGYSGNQLFSECLW